jgi:hypothetical protein
LSNALAYWAHTIDCFLLLIKLLCKLERLFAFDELFEASLMFAGKAKTLQDLGVI